MVALRTPFFRAGLSTSATTGFGATTFGGAALATTGFGAAGLRATDDFVTGFAAGFFLMTFLTNLDADEVLATFLAGRAAFLTACFFAMSAIPLVHPILSIRSLNRQPLVRA
jgi:hypothetical protein